MSETKKTKLEVGFYNVEFVKPLDSSSYAKGDKAVYHSSTAETLESKGIIKVLGKVKEYVPKGAKKD